MNDYDMCQGFEAGVAFTVCVILLGLAAWKAFKYNILGRK